MSELKENQAKAEQYLKRFKDNVTGHFINGEMLIPEGAETFDNPSPIDNTNLGQVGAGTTADVDQACEAAEAAFDEWRDMPGAERKKVLHRFADWACWCYYAMEHALYAIHLEDSASARGGLYRCS